MLAPCQQSVQGQQHSEAAIRQHISGLVAAADLQHLTQRGVRESLHTQLGLNAGSDYSKAWLRAEVDALVARRRSEESARPPKARGRRGVRQLEGDVRADEELELRRLESGLPPHGGGGSAGSSSGSSGGGSSRVTVSNGSGGGGGSSSGGGLVPPVSSEDVADVLNYYAAQQRSSGRSPDKKRARKQPQRVGIEQLITMALSAIDGSGVGRRAVQICAEVRRQFPQICANLLADDWQAQVQQALRARRDLFAKKVLRPGDEGARSSGRTVVYRLKKKPRRTFSEIFGAELLTGAERR